MKALQTVETWTHRHQCLGDAGQHGRPQRVDQDLVLGDGEHQQCDGVLRAQVLEQRGESAAAGERESVHFTPLEAATGFLTFLKNF